MARDHEPHAVTVGAPKPRLRGRLHQAAFIVSIPAALALVAAGGTVQHRVVLAVYGAALVNMFGTSAAYHRLPWSDRGLARMRSLDHSAIYLLIAGTYTPFCVLALEGPWRTGLLAGVWAGALALVGLKLTRVERLRALFGAMYLLLGWAAILALPEFLRSLPYPSFALMIAGGLSYTYGATVIARHRPDPDPLVFGYHEVWHVLMTLGAACHYAAVLVLVLSVG